MKRTRKGWAARRAWVLELYELGGGKITMEAIGAAFDPPITKQRVSQILKAAKRDAQRARCARGEHGETRTGSVEIRQGGRRWLLTDTTCTDCNTVLMREEQPL